MKQKITVLLFLIAGLVSTNSFAQDHVNITSGFGAGGYDLVSYFDNVAEKGNKKYTATFEGVNYKFSSAENVAKFQENPERYIPQYGGYCAYAIAVKGEKVGVNPKTFQIKDDKLYLFYNSWGVNTLNKWNEEGAAELQEKADAKWKEIGN